MMCKRCPYCRIVTLCTTDHHMQPYVQEVCQRCIKKPES